MSLLVKRYKCNAQQVQSCQQVSQFSNNELFCFQQFCSSALFAPILYLTILAKVLFLESITKHFLSAMIELQKVYLPNDLL